MERLVINSTDMAKPTIISATEFQWDNNRDQLIQRLDKLIEQDKDPIIIQVMSDYTEHLVLVTYIFTKKKNDVKK